VDSLEFEAAVAAAGLELDAVVLKQMFVGLGEALAVAVVELRAREGIHY